MDLVVVEAMITVSETVVSGTTSSASHRRQNRAITFSVFAKTGYEADSTGARSWHGAMCRRASFRWLFVIGVCGRTTHLL